MADLVAFIFETVSSLVTGWRSLRVAIVITAVSALLIIGLAHLF